MKQVLKPVAIILVGCAALGAVALIFAIPLGLIF